MAMKRNWMHLAVWATLAAATATVGGCGPSTMPVGQVSGRVTVHGEPAPGGRIYFVPEQGPSAAGLIDSNGQYQLTTRTAGDGAVVGTHRVHFGPPPPPRAKGTAEPVVPPPRSRRRFRP